MRRGVGAVLVVAIVITVQGMAQQTPPRDPQSAVAHLSYGVALLKAGGVAKALEEFNAANRMEPGSVQTMVWIGIAQNGLGHFSEAASSFRTALKIDATSQPAHYNFALTLVRLGKKQEAIRELQQVVKLNPSLVDAQYNLAVLLEEDGKYSEAISHLQAATRQRPSDSEIAVHLVDDYFKSHDDGDGVQLAQQTFDIHQDGEIAVRLGSLLVENGHFRPAVPMLESASSTSARSSASLGIDTLLARAYIGSGMPSKAIELLQPSRENDSSGQAAYLQGLAYLSDKQPEQAMAAFRMAVDRRPGDSAAHFHLGILLLKSKEQGDQAAGVREMQKAIDLAPHEGGYYAGLGRWLLEEGQIAIALAILQRGVDNTPPSAELYVLLAVAQASSQSTQLAQPMIEKAIALDPNIALSHDVLGFCYFRIGDYLQAAEAYKTASNLEPSKGRFAYDTALAFERANKIAEALPYAERAARIDPSVAVNHYLLGKLYGKLERKVEAVGELEMAVQLDPALDYPYYLLARMYMRLGDMTRAQAWNKKLQELKKAQMKMHGMGGMGVAMPEPQKASPALLLGEEQMDPEKAGAPAEH
jgi:tetratricopeptide (TPR) repeat protein